MRHPVYLLSPEPREGATHLPMISFALKQEQIDFGDCDLLMFSSRQAVTAAHSIDPSWKHYPCIAVGKGTQGRIEELGGRVIYTSPKAYGRALADAILTQFSAQKILYLRPETVAFAHKEYLGEQGYLLREQIIYATECRRYAADSKPPEHAIIIITSPSVMQCFLENFSWDSSYRAVVIGRTTEASLPAEVRYVLADEPSLDACIAKADELKGTSNNR